MSFTTHKEQIEAFMAESNADVSKIKTCVEEVIEAVDKGKLRVASLENGEWTTHAWIKNAILLYFRISEMKTYEVGPFEYFDKIPLKKNYAELKVRAVPPATAIAWLSPEPCGTLLTPGLNTRPLTKTTRKEGLRFVFLAFITCSYKTCLLLVTEITSPSNNRMF